VRAFQHNLIALAEWRASLTTDFSLTRSASSELVGQIRVSQLSSFRARHGYAPRGKLLYLRAMNNRSLFRSAGSG
jgi:hypothetical protein